MWHVATFRHMDYDIQVQDYCPDWKKLRDGNYILKYFYKCNYKRSFIQSIKNIKLIDKIPKIIVIWIV